MDADLQNHIRNEIYNVLVTSQNNMMSEIKNLLSSEIGKISSQQKEITDYQMKKTRFVCITSHSLFMERYIFSFVGFWCFV